MLSTNSNSFAGFFPIFMPCISFSCLIVLARTSTIKVTRVSILVLFLILKESFELKYYISCGLVIYNFYYVSLCSLYTHFVESFFFIINGCSILSEAFSASVEIIIRFLAFILLIWCIILIDL